MISKLKSLLYPLLQPPQVALHIQIRTLGLANHIAFGIHLHIEWDGVGLEHFNFVVDVLLTNGLLDLAVHLGGVPLCFGKLGAVVGLEGHDLIVFPGGTQTIGI